MCRSMRAFDIVRPQLIRRGHGRVLVVTSHVGPPPPVVFCNGEQQFECLTRTHTLRAAATAFPLSLRQPRCALKQPPAKLIAPNTTVTTLPTRAHRVCLHNKQKELKELRATRKTKSTARPREHVSSSVTTRPPDQAAKCMQTRRPNVCTHAASRKAIRTQMYLHIPTHNCEKKAHKKQQRNCSSS